jgi:hypothetical protein
MLAPPRPPSHDELEALIKEARARQLRRRLLGAAGVAIAAAIALSVYAFFTAGGVETAAGPPADHGRSGAPFCRSTQLTTRIGGQGATQMVLGGAVITNSGEQACALPTSRPLVRITWHGRPMHVRQPVPRRGEVQSGRPAHILGPGARALVSMRFASWCGFRAPGLPTFRLVFGRRLTLLASGLGVPRCNAGPGTRGLLDVSRPLRD